MSDQREFTCACGDDATLVCTCCHEPNCIDCMTDSGALCRDCDAHREQQEDNDE